MIINISYLTVIISLAKVIIYHLFFPGRAKQFVLLGFIFLIWNDLFIKFLYYLFFLKFFFFGILIRKTAIAPMVNPAKKTPSIFASI